MALGECWGVPGDDLLDTGRAWVQALGASDALGPRLVEFKDRVLAVYPESGQPQHRWTERFLGVRGFIDTRLATTPKRPTQLLHDTDHELVADFHQRCPASDLAAAKPRVGGDTILASAVMADDHIAAMCSLLPTPAGPPEVSVLTTPQDRGTGCATAAEKAVLIGAARLGIAIVQHRTIAQDAPSILLSQRCGFRLLTLEHIVKPLPAS